MHIPPSWSHWVRWLLLTTTAYSLILYRPQPILAQSAPPPALRITHVDTSHFPEVAVYVVGDNLPTDLDLATLPPTLQEDGASVAIGSDQVQSIGVQVALVLDAAGNVRLPGPTGDPRHVEVGRAARNLVKTGLLSAEQDWLTSVAFNQNKEIAALAPWSQDHQAVADSLYIYEPTEVGFTPLFDLLRFTLKLFDDPVLPQGQERAIVIFSDGIDVVSTTGLTDAVNLAAAHNIRIYPVMIGPQVEENRKKLEYLSTMTEGSYFHLASLENLDPLWAALAKRKQQRVFTYRSQQAQPRNVTVGLTLPDGRTLSTTDDIPGVNLRPFAVEATLPDGPTLTKYADAFDTPLDQLAPNVMNVQITMGVVDGYARAVQRVEYLVGDRIEVRNAPPFDAPFAFPIADFDDGTYSVRVRVVDELGLIGESAPLVFSVKVIRPPAPTPTPDVTLVYEATRAVEVAALATQDAVAAAQQAQEQAAKLEAEQVKAEAALGKVQTLTWATVASVAFGVVALAYAIYILSNRDRRRQATQIITGTIAAATEPFRPRRGGATNEPRAQLTLVDGGGSPAIPPVISLSRAGVRLGRDPSVVNVALADPRVSKLHCRILEDPTTGGYRILDEGSTSGTYVNDLEVNINGQVLQPNDLISIGPLVYRFEIIGLTPPSVSADTTKPFMRDDNTEPYVRTPQSVEQGEG